MTLTSAEHLAIELRQGMSSAEVEKLLGKPKRTALKQGSSSGVDASNGSLQWTYTWASATQRDDSLQVVFARKSSGEWLVESWGWNAFY